LPLFTRLLVVVRARYVSRDAEEKIKAAGGVVELVA
jgi:ribosomal protein L15